MKKSLLETILDPEDLSVRFQPIFRTGDNLELDSLEALVRGPHGTHFERADILFDYVRRKHAEAAMDRTCLRSICMEAVDLPPEVHININVHACTLSQRGEYVDFFNKETRKYDLDPRRFTVEIVEHAPKCNIPDLMDALTRLRDRGAKVALDDVGLGQSNYQMMLDCDPNYFKLDAYFVRGVSVDPRRLAVAHSVVTLAEAMGGSVVAEGVESETDLAELRRLGIKLFQANMLCPALPLQDLFVRGLFGSAQHKALSSEAVAQNWALDGNCGSAGALTF